MKYSIIVKKKFAYNNLIIDYVPECTFKLPLEKNNKAGTIWRERQKFATENNIRFYDGALYRLNHLYLDGKNVKLELGNCSYRDYVVTRTRNISDSNDQPVFADPLAICSAVITSDDKILIGKRVGVDGSIDKLHVVGGFVERTMDDNNHNPSPFHAISREINEEVGVDIPVDDILCLGIVYVETLPHPEMCFYARTERSYEHISKLTPRDLEVENWDYIEDNPDSLAVFIDDNYDNIASPGIATLLFYGEMRYGQKWLNSIRRIYKNRLI